MGHCTILLDVAADQNSPLPSTRQVITSQYNPVIRIQLPCLIYHDLAFSEKNSSSNNA